MGPAKSVVKGGHLDPNISTEQYKPMPTSNKFDFAKVVRMLMRGKN